MSVKNKHGIPVVQTSNKKFHKKNSQMRELDFKEFAELERFEEGFEVKITIPAFEPLVRAAINDGWTLVKRSAGEIV